MERMEDATWLYNVGHFSGISRAAWKPPSRRVGYLCRICKLRLFRNYHIPTDRRTGGEEIEETSYGTLACSM